MKCQNCWVILNLHVDALGIVESAFLKWRLQGHGAQEASPLLDDKRV